MSLSSRGRTVPLGTSLLLLVFWVVSGTTPIRPLVPRTTSTRQEVDQRVQRFLARRVMNYTVFLVDPISQTLYVGAKDVILSLTLDSIGQEKKVIPWSVPDGPRLSCMQKGKKEVECHNYIRLLEFVNRTHIYTCGTYAFNPQCGYIEPNGFPAVTQQESGRGKCPFQPAQQFAAVMADGTLYSATMNNFLSTEPLISRVTGNKNERIRTDSSPMWLNDPTFVASSFVRESAAGDDDKLYFFFTETGKEYDCFKKVKVPRVARVCKGDVGGQKTLQKRWTTFLKTQLMCSDTESGILFNTLQDVFTVQSHNWESTVFYGVFSSDWDRSDVTAICVYDILDIHKALGGAFKAFEQECDRWKIVHPDDIPTPRPGTCITDSMKKKGVTNFPDRMLNFIRDHPLMEQIVTPRNNEPLLVKFCTRYRKIAVLKVAALDGSVHDVLFLGTDDGHLHKVVSFRYTTFILEDLALFPEDQPVESLKLHKNWLYIGSSKEVAQVKVTDCERHNSCRKCILARDPACAWNPSVGSCLEHKGLKGLLQDVAFGNVLSLCPSGKDSMPAPITLEVPVVLGMRVVLPCTALSSWSTCEWSTPTQTTDDYVSRSDGLEFTVVQDKLGDYACHCKENDSGGLVASYSVVKSAGRTSAQGHSERNHAVLAGLLCFLAGVAAGCAAFAIYKRKQQIKWERNQQKTGLDLMQSTTTSCSHEPQTPSSPEDERHPLANDKKNGGMNGFTHYYIAEKDQARIFLSNAPLAQCDETSI